MKNQVKNLELGQEYPTIDEAETIQNIIKIHVESFLKRNTQPVQRTEHPKHHGCVRAEFTIAADLPASLKVGIFSQPRVFPAWIRFSNGQEQDDQYVRALCAQRHDEGGWPELQQPFRQQRPGPEMPEQRLFHHSHIQ